MLSQIVLLVSSVVVNGVTVNPFTTGSFATFRQPTPRMDVIDRRNLLVRGSQVASVLLSTSLSAPASASLTESLKEGEAALAQATDSRSATAALTGLLDITREYEGLPSNKMKEEVVNAMRDKRTSLQQMNAWDGISEEAYNSLMRSVDPWRVVELEPIAQRTLFIFAPIYIGLLALQQVLPKYFNVAYGVAAALVLGPLFLQIVIG